MNMNYFRAMGLAVCSLVAFGCSPKNPAEDTNNDGDQEKQDTVPVVVVEGFSVSATQYVHFATSNLQYQASTKTWRFAPNAYDTIGTANAAVSDTYDGWIDLFGWGTSSNPTEHISYTEDADYYKYYPTTFVDWGTNVIGTDTANTWRTLTRAEWKYLFFTRPNAEKLFAGATVNGVHGFILLPDSWTTPEGITLTPSIEKGMAYSKGSYVNEDASAATSNFTHNIFSSAEWQVLEKAGAVFLPVTGCRWGVEVRPSDTQWYCNYWSSTLFSAEGYPASYWAQFSWSTMSIGYSDNAIGAAVRLVRDVH